MVLPVSAAASLPPPVELPGFEGPLDLLLDEVRRQNVAIEQVAMAPIVARFLEYVESAAERNLKVDIEWLHMAATLIHWKSQSLLPRAIGTDPQKDPIRDELIRQLLAHRKEAAGELARRRTLEEARFSRVPAVDAEDEPEDLGFVSVWDLIHQARELARWVEQRRDDRRSRGDPFEVEEDISIREMMAYLHARLAAANGKLDGAAMLKSQPTASRRSCLFLGMLEMARDRQIELQQDDGFGPISMRLISNRF